MISAETSIARELSRRDAADEYAEAAIAARADTFALAWLSGQWDATITRGESLASIVSEQLCDSPGNEFRAVLEIVRRFARSGDSEACALIERLARDHAVTVYERGGLL
jgi:hypothetical protein